MHQDYESDHYDFWFDDNFEDWAEYQRRRTFWGLVAVVVIAGLILGFPLLLTLGAR